MANQLKEKIKQGKKIFGTLLNMGETYVAEIYGYFGFDFVWVDTEHSSAATYERLLNNLTILGAHKTPTLVRVGMDDYNHIKRVLEMGPDGIIFPNVETAEYADKCMKATLYPPYGNRGSGPLRANKYGLIPMQDYVADQFDNLCRFIQIESKKCIDNLEEIIKNPYIDGYILGPYDLSGSIGKLGDVECEENVALIEKAIKILKDNGKYVGMAMTSTEYQDQKRWYDRGVDMVCSGAEFDYVMRETKKTYEQLKELVKHYE